MDLNTLSKQRSQILRKNMTKEERHLWYDFLKQHRLQFKRQYTLGVYIVDFYCYQAKLIIELDGSQHCEPATVAYDQQRTTYLQQLGYYVLRISNRDVMARFRDVCAMIDDTIAMRMGDQ